jgi:hypothetical protein
MVGGLVVALCCTVHPGPAVSDALKVGSLLPPGFPGSQICSDACHAEEQLLV